jgi:hypothetical protein
MSQLRKCPGQCGLFKTHNEFYFQNNKPSGHCKECKKEYMKKYRREPINKQFMAIERKKRKRYLLDDVKCEWCEKVVPLSLLDFAHRDRKTKKHNIGRIMFNNEDELEEERDKCDVLCAHCHLIDTHKQNNSYKHIFMTTGVKPKKGDRSWQQKLHVLNYLLERQCEDCGEKDVRVLEFDHINPETKYMAVCDMIGKNERMVLLEIEIAKTRILCRECHRRHTYGEVLNIRINDNTNKQINGESEYTTFLF